MRVSISGYGQWTTTSKGIIPHIIFDSSSLNVRIQCEEPLNTSVPLPRPSDDFKFKEIFGGGLVALG